MRSHGKTQLVIPKCPLFQKDDESPPNELLTQELEKVTQEPQNVSLEQLSDCKRTAEKCPTHFISTFGPTGMHGL